MREIIEKYQADVEEYKNKSVAIEEKKEQLLARIERTRKQLAKLEDAEYKLHRPSRHDIICALAEKLSEHIGLPYEIYGPFGLEAETSIYLRKDMSKRISEQKTISIHLRPFGDRENDWIAYDTGEKIDRYQKGSIGELNGYNSVYAPLPKDFDEILKLMTISGREEIDLASDEMSVDDLLVDAQSRSTEAVNNKSDVVREEIDKEIG